MHLTGISIMQNTMLGGRPLGKEFEEKRGKKKRGKFHKKRGKRP